MKSAQRHIKTNILFKIILLFLIFLLNFSVQAQNGSVDEARQKEGKKLFKSLCASCHKLDKKLVGPALKGIASRKELSWLKSWIRNNSELRASGDADAIAIFEEYNGSVMSTFPQLTDKNIEDILYYTTVGEIKKAPVQNVATTTSSSNNSNQPQWVIWVLAAAIFIGFLIIINLIKTVNELKGAPKTLGVAESLSQLWNGVRNNTFLHVLGVVFGVLIGIYILFGTLFKIGVDEGYQPIQPIAFSHKIHAGDNKIDCQYCHSSAKHSKTSGIPSANVCMNCHKNISEVAEDTKIEGKNKAQLDYEIQKLYKAVGWDSENLQYTGKTNPIKWVRVHNLPDFVYFNHSQHVTVAGVKCQKCHGPIQTMDEVYQYSPLTMGWCISCHKGTNVPLKNNGYYKKIHEQLAKKYGIEKVTIAQLGGKECGKCHY